jgi:hypothetical protein
MGTRRWANICRNACTSPRNSKRGNAPLFVKTPSRVVAILFEGEYIVTQRQEAILRSLIIAIVALCAVCWGSGVFVRNYFFRVKIEEIQAIQPSEVTHVNWNTQVLREPQEMQDILRAIQSAVPTQPQEGTFYQRTEIITIYTVANKYTFHVRVSETLRTTLIEIGIRNDESAIILGYVSSPALFELIESPKEAVTAWHSKVHEMNYNVRQV